MKYQVTVTVNIYPLDDKGGMMASNSLYHHQQFVIGGDDVTTFAQIAPTIDAVYESIQRAVEAASDS